MTQTATAIAIAGSTDLTGIAPVLDLQSTGAVTQTAALANVGTLTGNTGAVTLTGTGNSIGAIGSYLSLIHILTDVCQTALPISPTT